MYKKKIKLQKCPQNTKMVNGKMDPKRLKWSRNGKTASKVEKNETRNVILARSTLKNGLKFQNDLTIKKNTR